MQMIAVVEAWAKLLGMLGIARDRLEIHHSIERARRPDPLVHSYHGSLRPIRWHTPRLHTA